MEDLPSEIFLLKAPQTAIMKMLSDAWQARLLFVHRLRSGVRLNKSPGKRSKQDACQIILDSSNSGSEKESGILSVRDCRT